MDPLSALADLLVPPRCAACARPSRAGLCAVCSEAADALSLPDLGRAWLEDGVLAVAAFAYDGVVRDALRGVKAGGRHAAATGLGDLLRARVRPPGPGPGIAVTWVPSTRRRLRERGVEVPRLLAGRGAAPLLRRVVDRPDQTTLSRAARRSSPHGVFVAAARPPPGVVLVDDVRTTGATATAAAAVLRARGARRVLVVTLAAGGDQARSDASLGRRGRRDGRPATGRARSW